ncbi:hypothetical protein OG730_27135 [Streptomyces sp. NBC_01298]|uniref:ATP-grasp domain-containing protein n=1 Tax=Streptomyces sp. NBC_01298 TaxID=2903817 RepID=UPI002E104BB9|nr:hypothetical protein OG730_27135 [Streptomyces sp. NBC_01298]
MKILVVHQLPYRKADYRQALDHRRHDVTYAGHPDRMADLPPDLPCRRVEIPAHEDLVEGVISRTRPDEGYEQVLSLSEFGVIAAWSVRRHLGLAGPSLRQIERSHDKVSMKEALTGSGLRFPRFARPAHRYGLLPWTGASVLKPRRGTCSQDVTVHASARKALEAYWALENPADYELEEYVDGDILHADGVVRDGELRHLVVSRYVNKPIDFAGGVPLGSVQLPLSPRHQSFADTAVAALGIESGCVHLEFFETPRGELVFLEIANRMGGAGVVQAHGRHTGVHLPSHDIAARLGLEEPPAGPASGRFHGWLVFPGHHLGRNAGRVVTVPPALRRHPCVDTLHILPPHHPLPDHITYQEWLVPVAVEASHSDPRVLAEFLAECATKITIRTESAA